MTARRRLEGLPPRLFSDRAGAAYLGVSREALAELRRLKLLRVVPWLGGWRIPLAELERLAAEGVTLNGRRLRQVKRRVTGSPADAIRAIDVEDL